MNEEEKQTEVIEEGKESTPVETKSESLGSPKPYKNKDREDVWKEDEPNNEQSAATVDKDTEETSEATPEEQRPASAEEKVFKKRYDDLKRHHDSTIGKHKDELLRLKKQVEEATKKAYLPQMSKEELDDWRKENPEMYDVMKTLAYEEADEKSKAVESKLEEIKNAQLNLAREKAEVELLKLHPDFYEIKSSDEFHQWAEEQDDMIKNWLYNNFDNAKLAARAIDLYKMDAGLSKKAKVSSAEAKAEAAKAVTRTRVGDENKIKDKKVWSLKEISKLKPHEFDKLESEIDLAKREGRITA
jgi:uncharacterized protein YutD